MEENITKKAVLIIAEKNYSEEELLTTKRVLEQSGITIDVACAKTGQARGNRGGVFSVGMPLSEVSVVDFDAVIFIGGNGSQQYWNDSVSHALAKEAFFSGKVTAAICSASVTLANAGLLDGKKATVWFAEEQALRRKGANYTGRAVEIDANIITANGPASAADFGRAIVEKIKEMKK